MELHSLLLINIWEYMSSYFVWKWLALGKQGVSNDQVAELGYIQTVLGQKFLLTIHQKYFQSLPSCLSTQQEIREGASLTYGLENEIGPYRYYTNIKTQTCKHVLSYTYLSIYLSVNWITITRKFAEHLHMTYGNTGQLFRPNNLNVSPLFGRAITMISWFGVTCVRYKLVAQL